MPHCEASAARSTPAGSVRGVRPPRRPVRRTASPRGRAHDPAADVRGPALGAQRACPGVAVGDAGERAELGRGRPRAGREDALGEREREPARRVRDPAGRGDVEHLRAADRGAARRRPQHEPVAGRERAARRAAAAGRSPPAASTSPSITRSVRVVLARSDVARRPARAGGTRARRAARTATSTVVGVAHWPGRTTASPRAYSRRARCRRG